MVIGNMNIGVSPILSNQKNIFLIVLFIFILNFIISLGKIFSNKTKLKAQYQLKLFLV